MKPWVGVALMTAVALGGCGKDPAAQAARDHSAAGAQPASYTTSMPRSSKAIDEENAPDARTAPVPNAKDGKPLWTANKRHTAEENAEYAFERNGEAFGAKDLDAFVAKAHAFVAHPPAGTEKIARANGDVELYDAKTNTFAVASKVGAPRTMFKPDNGPDYWAKEEAKNGDQGDRGSKAKGDSKRAGKKKSRDQDDG